ncbi:MULTISPECIES: hypothetical protein [Rufibacter]|uniref:hypothetical protein n=1 Tax=Rufibacter TaxID=1379908 RepID=UPI001B302440|nr:MULTISPECIES: hypothetical protein [Rufibacter]
MKTTGITLLFTLLSLVSYGQSRGATEKFKANLLPSKTGALLTYNGQEHAFTITMDADSVRPSDTPGIVYVNGMIVQAGLVPVPAGLYKDSLTDKRQFEILQAYVAYEMEYFKKDLNINHRDLEVYQGLFGGKPFVVWTFSMPKNDNIRKQIYISGICFNQTLSLNIPVRSEKDFEKSLELLTQMAKTVKEYDRPLDLNQLYKELN